MKKKLFSLLLVAALCVSLITPVFAAGESEPNNDSDSATTVPLNTDISASFAKSGSNIDHDWYKFTLSNPGGISLTAETPTDVVMYYDLYGVNSSGSLVSLTDSNFWYVNNSVASTATHSSDVIYLNSGTYYFDLRNSSGEFGDYSFRINYSSRSAGTLEFEPNDDSIYATEVNLDTDISGSFTPGTNIDHDWYKFTLSSPGSVTLSGVTPTDVVVYFDLYGVSSSGSLVSITDANFWYVNNSVNSSAGHEYYPVYLDSGTYYLDLRNSSGEFGEYSFRLSYNSRSAGSLEIEPNDNSEEATEVSLNTNIAACFICGTNIDHDWYKFTLPSSGSVTLSMESPAGTHIYIDAYSVSGSGALSKIYDTSFMSISNTVSDTKNNSTETLHLNGGTYYIDVRNSSGDFGEYVFKLVSDVTSTVASESPSSWAAAEVNAAIANGLVPSALQTGYTNPISRGMVAEMFIRLIEKSTGKNINTIISEKGLAINNNAFSDTTDQYVLAANALGIINGVGGGKFNPSGTLTRAQIAAIINRIADLLGVSTTGYSHNFTDVSGHWVSSELGWPVHAKIITGVGSSRFNPNGLLTTEQAIAIVQRTFNAL